MFDSLQCDCGGAGGLVYKGALAGIQPPVISWDQLFGALGGGDKNTAAFICTICV